jgi:Flp pilus assembly pilin Flp
MSVEIISQAIQRKRQKGITTVEYVIMLVLIAVGVLLAGPSLVSAIVGIFSKTSSLIGK